MPLICHSVRPKRMVRAILLTSHMLKIRAESIHFLLRFLVGNRIEKKRKDRRDLLSFVIDKNLERVQSEYYTKKPYPRDKAPWLAPFFPSRPPFSAHFRQWTSLTEKGRRNKTRDSINPPLSVVVRLQPEGGLSAGILIWSGNGGFWRENLAKPNNKKAWKQ